MLNAAASARGPLERGIAASTTSAPFSTTRSIGASRPTISARRTRCTGWSRRACLLRGRFFVRPASSPASFRSMRTFRGQAAYVATHPGVFALGVLRAFRANQGLLLAGAVAYYTLLSIVPLLILMLIALSQIIDQGSASALCRGSGGSSVGFARLAKTPARHMAIRRLPRPLRRRSGTGRAAAGRQRLSPSGEARAGGLR